MLFQSAKERKLIIICCVTLYFICLTYYGIRVIYHIPRSLPASWEEISPGNDPAIYAAQANLMISGKSLFAWKEQFHRSPFMPYYLTALWSILGSNVKFWIMIHLSIVSVLPIPIFLWVYKKTQNLIPAILSSLLIIADTEIASLATSFYPVSLATPLMVLLVWILELQKNKKSYLHNIIIVISLLCLSLLRTNALSLIPLVSILLFCKSFRIKDIFYSIFMFLLISVLYFGIIGTRNKIVAEKWIFLPTQGPVNVIIGNEIPDNVNLTNIGPSDPKKFALFQNGLARIQNWSNNQNRTFDPYPIWFYPEVNPYLNKVIWKSIKENTTHHLTILCKKFVDFWFDKEFWNYTLLLILGAIGLFVSNKKKLLLIPMSLIVMWFLPLKLVLFFQRHRTPMIPLIYSTFIMGIYFFIKYKLNNKWISIVKF